jgi:peptidyl-prolyl cis-trans isomerase SurA
MIRRPIAFHDCMIDFRFRRTCLALVASLAVLLAETVPAAAAQRADVRNGDYIAVVVNQEVVTAGEIDRRVQHEVAAAGPGARLPPMAELRRRATDALIDERVMISDARESGIQVDDADVDRAVKSIAAQNQISVDTLRQRLVAQGTDYVRFRDNLRDQIMIERLREREVYQRIKISDADIDKYLAHQHAAALADAPTDIAQILIAVPEGANAATVAERRAKAEAALARVRGGEPFGQVAREVSEDGNHEAGGEIGLRPASRLPDVFIEATKGLKDGEVAAHLLRTDAGFHVLKLIERKEQQVGHITQTHVRHVLLRTSPELTTEVAERRLAEYRQEIESGRRSFEEVARQYSEDASAAAGGDLGWASPGVMVPEFESAMNALPVGGLSQPVVSRFGVHLIQVLARRDVTLQPRQLREQARNELREQKFEQAYLDWTKELRSRAYVEYREPPQ